MNKTNKLSRDDFYRIGPESALRHLESMAFAVTKVRNHKEYTWAIRNEHPPPEERSSGSTGSIWPRWTLVYYRKPSIGMIKIVGYFLLLLRTAGDTPK